MVKETRETKLVCIYFTRWIGVIMTLEAGADPGGVRGVRPNPPWLASHFVPPRHLWTNIKTTCFSCLCHLLQFAILSTSFVSPGPDYKATGWLVSARYRSESEWTNILLEGIICREPADTELQSSRSHNKNSLKNLKFVRWGRGGGGVRWFSNF